jgi:predicted GNAT family N-acyltransferase
MSGVVLRLARSKTERADVVRLRDAVYVQDQGRLADVADTAGTFDRYDAYAEYILAYDGDEAVGTVKLIADSAAGLPCDTVVDLTELRGLGDSRLVEFGHLMTLPRIRGQEVGMALMREGLVRCVARHGATHILGDFFVDDGGGLRSFYTDIGFVGLGAPYQDARFKDAPLSLVGVLDVRAAAARARSDTELGNRPLQYFFHDYDEYAAGGVVGADTAAGAR